MKELKYTRTCFKIQFTSRKEAKTAMKKFNQYSKMGLQDSYFCPECQAWHHTSMSKKKSRKETRKNRNKP